MSLSRFPARAGVATLVERVSLTPRMLRVTLHCDDFRERWPAQQPG
jgi:NADPH-dependent ferric siderophore reductase